MTIRSCCKLAAAGAVLLAGTAAFGQPGGTRSVGSLPPLPDAANHASNNSHGEPNANGHKPGLGHGYGHFKDIGRGHEIGLGHGHDDDHNLSPG
jgi:hypothetical protein